MKDTLSIESIMTAEQNEDINQTVRKESRRLLDFIRKRVPDEEDAEDILQDVFYQLTETYRLMKPVEQVSAWLFTVARNKITDLFRKKRPEAMSKHQFPKGEDDDDVLSIADLLPDNNVSPDGAYARKIIMQALEEGLDELPEKQREVFIMHEIEDRSFNEIAEITGDKSLSIYVACL